MGKKTNRPSGLNQELANELRRKTMGHLTLESAGVAGLMLKNGEIEEDKLLETITSYIGGFRNMVIEMLKIKKMKDAIKRTIKGLKGGKKEAAMNDLARQVATTAKWLFVKSTGKEGDIDDVVLLSEIIDKEEVKGSEKLPAKTKKARQ